MATAAHVLRALTRLPASKSIVLHIHRRPTGRCRKSVETDMTSEPQRSRAVFSTEDFGLLKEAVGAYVRQIADEPRSAKFSNLYHRLGRLG